MPKLVKSNAKCPESAVQMEVLREQLIADCQRQLGGALPAVLTSSDIERLGIRSTDSLAKDANRGTGLLPLPGKKRGRLRKYLSTHVIDFALGLRKEAADDP